MEEDKLNNLSKKLFENLEFEKPPKDFTEKLMLKIELAKKPLVVKSSFFQRNKFMLIFVFTFGIISILGFLSTKNASNTDSSSISEKYNLPSFDFSIISKYLDVNIDFGFIAKLILGSIIILIVIDLISGTLIDRIIDSKTKKGNGV
jgi:uncharacterized protein YozE (UPF0346 family)